MEKITNSTGKINNSQPIETTDKNSNSHPFDKALKAISKPVLKEGLITQFHVENSDITIKAHKTISSAVRKMFSRIANKEAEKGEHFKEILNRRTFDSFKSDNIKKTLLLLDEKPQSDEEKAFIANFQDKKINLTHFSNRSFSPGETLFSRKSLEERGAAFNTENTGHADIRRYNTTDFVFFAIEFGSEGDNPTSKTRSRFGDKKLTLKMEDYTESIKHGSVALIDYAKSRDYVAWEMKDKMRKEDYSVKEGCLLSKSAYQEIMEHLNFYSLEDMELTYHVKDMKTALAHNIVKDLRALRDSKIETFVNYANTILSARSDNHLNEIVSNLYRPQVMVPRALGIKNNSPSLT
jgi:ribosomal protein S21